MICNCFARGFGQIKKPIALLLRNHHNGSIQFTWRKPEIGCIKLNFDGASKNGTQNASIGGVYRDHQGVFLLGFTERIGTATSSVAELVAAKRGLELALQNGWLNIWIEGDAKGVVDLLCSNSCSKSKDAIQHGRDISVMIPQLNNFSVSHIYREGNRVADKLAKMGYKVRKPRIWRDVPPDEVLQFLRQDAVGEFTRRKK